MDAHNGLHDTDFTHWAHRIKAEGGAVSQGHCQAVRQQTLHLQCHWPKLCRMAFWATPDATHPSTTMLGSKNNHARTNVSLRPCGTHRNAPAVSAAVPMSVLWRHICGPGAHAVRPRPRACNQPHGLRRPGPGLLDCTTGLRTTVAHAGWGPSSADGHGRQCSDHGGAHARVHNMTMMRCATRCDFACRRRNDAATQPHPPPSGATQLPRSSKAQAGP